MKWPVVFSSGDTWLNSPNVYSYRTYGTCFIRKLTETLSVIHRCHRFGIKDETCEKVLSLRLTRVYSWIPALREVTRCGMTLVKVGWLNVFLPLSCIYEHLVHYHDSCNFLYGVFKSLFHVHHKNCVLHVNKCTYRVQQKKSGPLSFFAVFSATVWVFSMKFYSFIY